MASHQQDVSDTGSHTRDDSAITFFRGDEASITGTVSGDTITLSDDGFVFVYRR